MVELQFTDYHHYSDILLDLKMAPEDLVVPIPKFFVEEREAEAETRNKLLVP
jgi:hypothetical protein